MSTLKALALFLSLAMLLYYIVMRGKSGLVKLNSFSWIAGVALFLGGSAGVYVYPIDSVDFSACTWIAAGGFTFWSSSSPS